MISGTSPDRLLEHPKKAGEIPSKKQKNVSSILALPRLKSCQRGVMGIPGVVWPEKNALSKCTY